MTRPAAAARKNHGSRHENGHASSGKKVSKQKSNGHLNGTPNGQHRPDPIALTARNPSKPQSSSSSAANNKTNGDVEELKMESNGQVQVNGHGKGDPGMSNGHAYASGSTNGALGTRIEDQISRRSEKMLNSASNVKKPYAGKSVNPFHLASTILKACPMADTIAILIFLLQLPPIVLTLVQFLYASMTFMLPAGVSTGTLTSNFDIFQGPAGTPSLGTMIAMDAFCLLVWALFMWNWARNFAIDLAHVQVAIALGAGSSGDTGGVNAFCVTVLLIVHLFRSEGIQDFVFGHLLSTNFLSSDLLEKYSNLIPMEFKQIEYPSPPSWVRSLLAIHILAQAGTAMARRSMAKNRSQPRAKTGKRLDTEASTNCHIESSVFESGIALPPNANSEVSSLPGSISKEGRDRVSSAKKRRRQANEARRIQPFWAALASTKLTVTREYERSRHSTWYSPSFPVAEDDLDKAPLGTALIWITHVDSCSIKFAASDFTTEEDPMTGGTYEGSVSDAEADPFYIRVNGAHWAPVSLNRITENSDELSLVHWRGEIAGLAPDCAYACSFVRCDTDEEICVMSVKTPATSDTDQASITASISPSPRQSLRPSSPTTTIKNSIMNADAKLTERRAKLKRSRNEHKLQISKIKKELDNFTHRLNSGGDDTRQKQRSLQLERNIRQTEEATAALDQQLDSLEKSPDEEIQEWEARKAAFELEKGKLEALKDELHAAKSATDRGISTAENELANTVQKRERLQNRRNRLSEQYERITHANNQGLNERERRAAEQLAKEQEHARIEEGFQEQLTSITRSLEEYQVRTTQLWQQATAIEQAYQQQQLFMSSGPLTPEGELPGTKRQPMDTNVSTNSMSTAALGNKSNFSMAFPAYSSTEKPGLVHRSSMSPIMHSSLPVGYCEPQYYPPSPLAKKQSMFVPDTGGHRDRSLSNFSRRSTHVEYNAPLYAGDGADADATRSHTSVLSPVNHNLAQFKRADSRNSGSASGSGSGSGAGSPHSSRGKPIWS
ncbi:AcrB protein [Uncinocarpus reesii 1704]|uniref:AcrB protein n=1 Tax=Uncinocarpus reesii (strain UAMH 1704) TaxID=336963 RepID=C4JKR8_UNCRE|nr:AcrB protein [Uncinocarpus reesii 1704]EEP75767.1 AcrB protein [Uncinocarpus reesii 1704]